MQEVAKKCEAAPQHKTHERAKRFRRLTGARYDG